MTVNDSDMCVRWKDDAWSIPKIQIKHILFSFHYKLCNVKMTNLRRRTQKMLQGRLTKLKHELVENTHAGIPGYLDLPAE